MIMFQFVRCSDGIRKLAANAAPVSCTLAVGGQYNGAWKQLRDEPIELREIGYADGKLLYLDYDGREISDDAPAIFENLIADILSM